MVQNVRTGVWVFAEQRKGKLQEITLEILGGALHLARKLGSPTSAILIGNHVRALAEELVTYGANRVYLAEHPLLDLYQSDVYASILADLVVEHKPEILLLGATSIGSDLAPSVAAKVQTGLSAHVVGLDIDEEARLWQMVPGFGRNTMAIIICPDRRPQMATVRRGVLRKPQRKVRGEGEIIRVDVDIDFKDLRTRTLDILEEKALEAPIEEAEVVIAGGWGMRETGGFEMLQELARILGGSVGGTRPAVDEGWIEEERMIGQSGRTVRPRLYIGVGISGQMHHIVGILNSEVIVVINRDPEAPIFEVADLGVVKDLEEILPFLIKELKRFKHEQA
ncbi:MAG: electron transfer flavoprotein subunit alpha [Nitrososphaeria archaeon]|nr:electron transfer flavoprotein subunit alpha [Nitrososphaeria archaeon]NIN53279.1 electron transfer flavoprotein subunit alpha [Nitrososphaeria archaeon]NIQ33730.1 electron transfer flavoprotein subunit alpha [Nitrososphaeria archaeon]